MLGWKPLVLSCAFVSFASWAQEPAHAPDYRAQKLIAPLDFPPKPNAPFTAIAKTTWVQILPDNSTITYQNERVVARDMDGRIFQERRTFVPVPDDGKQQSRAHMLDYSDPVEHTLYRCNPAGKICNLFPYYQPATQPLRPAGLQPDQMSFLTRENLGTDTFEGLEVQRTRETFTFYKESIGNTKTILRVVDYWYSPDLGVNVKVVRHDPRDGDQTLWLTDISRSAADQSYFKIPSGFRIIDHRGSESSGALVGRTGP
ncbi:MAG TPA: hypothetical protein VFB43_09335 [Terracidiphilus sp.]|nr:hypothetical protein [Terracidiphilus sp.]